MTLSQDILQNTIPGRVYTPAEIAEMLGYPRSSNVKKALDDLVEYRYFERWKSPKRYHGRETYAYMRVD